MDIFILSANNMCKYDQMMKCISLKFYVPLSCFFWSQKLSRYDTCFIYMFEFLDHIKFCKVVLDIFKVNMEYSVHSAHFNFFIWSENVKK